MPSYALTEPEMRILLTWLFEPSGYLDTESVGQAQTARQAMAASKDLDVTQWVREQGSQGWKIDGLRRDSSGSELAMVWWIWKNHQIEAFPPPEAATWVEILKNWDASIDVALARSPELDRDIGSVSLFDEGGTQSAMPAGSHLAQQKMIISKVLGVLQG